MASSSSSSPEISAAEAAVDARSRFSYKDATQDEVLEDLSSRFILNLPDEELNSLERVCFQVEQAHWFYEDFIREENHKLPSMPLKRFSEMLFQACPLLHQWSHDHEEAFKNFMQYKTRVPVCGAIMLNDTMDKCVLVKGWKASSNWGFPKGKINETEPTTACAIREVLEETGYSIANQIDPSAVVELSIKEQRITLYIVPGVPEDFNFQTRTRKEISQIAWFKLSDLPTWKRNKGQLPNKKFYLISPFIGPLKNFINERRHRNTNGKKNGRQRTANGRSLEAPLPEPQSNGAVATGHEAQIANGQNKNEAELGPELTRLFSGLAAISGKGTNDHPSNDKPGNESAADSSSNPSNSSSNSPVAHRLQSSVHQPPTTKTVSEATTRPTTSQSRPTLNQTPSQQTDHQPPLKSGTPSLSSASPASPRRTSATADISPYLTRRTEVPVSAKTLQQLQLLETVADESAKIAAKAVSPNGRQPSAPPLSAPPQQFTHPVGPYPPHPGLSSSAAGFHSRPPLPIPNGASNMYPDHLQMRSHTSQAFNRPMMHNPTGSVSLNQNSLLAVLNGARSGPIPDYAMNPNFLPQHRIPQPMTSPPYLPPHQPHVFSMPAPTQGPGLGPLPGMFPPGFPPQHRPTSQMGLNALLGQLPGPEQVPVGIYPPPNPNFTLGMVHAPPAPNNPLLSILNGGRPMPVSAQPNLSQIPHQ